MAEELLTMFDAEVKEVQITRRQWVEQILPENIREAWDDHEALYALLVAAVNEKMGPSIYDSIKRLAEIDPDPHRPAVLEGVALMQEGKNGEAERVFRTYIEKHGPTASMMTNLAKIALERGENAQSEEMLQKALELDANLEGCLAWHINLTRSRGGDEAAWNALKQIGQNPKNWRARLWMASLLLKQDHAEPALELYRQVASSNELPASALVQMTGDLGNAGRVKELVEIIYPVYKLKTHGPYAGLNLVQALLAVGKNQEANVIIGQLQDLKDPGMDTVLAGLTARLAAPATPQSSHPLSAPAAANTSFVPPPKAGGPPEVGAVPLVKPLWMVGLYEPEWLLPPLKGDAVKVAIFTLADQRRTEKKDKDSEPAKVDAHPLTRSLPVFLAEGLRLWSDASAMCVVPVAKGVGPMLPSGLWPLPQMLASCPAGYVPDYVVCGALTKGSRGSKVELHVFRVKDKQPIKTLRVAVSDDFKGAPAGTLKELLNCLGECGVKAIESVGLAAPGDLDVYTSCLDRLLLQTLAGVGLMDPGRLGHPDAMIEFYFKTAEAETQSPLPGFIAAAGVAAVARFAGQLVPNYRQRLLGLFENRTNTHLGIKRLMPAIYKLLGDPAGFTAEWAIAQESASGEYAQWLAALGA
jgi:tetratricopeptide (TPR) repeat protein